MEVITEAIKDNLLFVIIGVIVLLLLLTALFIMLRKRKKKQEEAEAEEVLEEVAEELPEGEGIETEEEAEEDSLTPELLNIQNERSQELRERVRAFADENPELSAQMLKNWLRGGDDDVN